MNSKSTPLLIILLVITAFTGGYWFKGKTTPKTATDNSDIKNVQATPSPTAQKQPAEPTVTLDQVKALFTKDHVTFGDVNKKVLFVEISDPSCPYCQVAAGKNPSLNAQISPKFKLISDGGTYVAPVVEMKKLIDQGKAGYVWIYFPGHGNGELGSEALYCAFDEGKFWQVHDKLMTAEGYDLMNNQIKNDRTKLSVLATFLKSTISSQKFSDCLNNNKYQARLQQDTNVGIGLGVQGTPMFVVNSALFPGAYSYKDMELTVSNLLK